jgi:hypothetical protein
MGFSRCLWCGCSLVNLLRMGARDLDIGIVFLWSSEEAVVVAVILKVWFGIEGRFFAFTLFLDCRRGLRVERTVADSWCLGRLRNRIISEGILFVTSRLQDFDRCNLLVLSRLWNWSLSRGSPFVIFGLWNLRLDVDSLLTVLELRDWRSDKSGVLTVLGLRDWRSFEDTVLAVLRLRDRKSVRRQAVMTRALWRDRGKAALMTFGRGGLR